MKRSKFSLSHYKLLSCDMGELVPVGCMEVLPGDTIQHAVSTLVRASPMLAPVMHPVHIRIHNWFVPYRIIWEDWEDFITGGPDGADASVFPTMSWTVGAPPIGSLGDYLGVPAAAAGGIVASALPFRAYGLIWNEWYRDQDLQSEVVVSLASGADTTTSKALLHCDWEKDYFTSARPWEQKGPAVTIPITGDAPVGASPGGVFAQAETTSVGGDAGAIQNAGTGAPYANDLLLSADMSMISGVTINDLREALAIQRFEEARARYGSRYVEYLRYLGVRSSDARLQRPEYLGGGRETLQFSEVLQTAPDASTGVVGTMRGHGIAALRSRRYRRFFEEHGVVLSLMSVKPKTMYGQGLHRMFNRRVKEDFWQKELQHIGQQEVLNKELYGGHTTPDGVFGYQDRYDEYRRMESSLGGEFRSSTLDFWHFARIFASDPALNASFVSCVPTERTFASSATDVLYVMAMHSIQARRMVSRTGSSFTF